MTSDGRTSVRSLDAESCAAVTAAAAVIVALTIESHAPDTRDDPAADAGLDDDASPAPDAMPDASSAPVSPAPSTANDEAPPDVPHSPPSALPFFLQASALGSLGILPRAAAGFGAGLGFARGPLRVEAIFDEWPTVSQALTGDSSRGGSFRALLGGARVCGVREGGFVSLGLCGEWTFTAMHAEAYGVTVPIAAGTSWSSIRADALVVVPLSRVLGLRATLSAGVPFARPLFEVDGAGVVFRPSSVDGELGLGAEAHF